MKIARRESGKSGNFPAFVRKLLDAAARNIGIGFVKRKKCRKGTMQRKEEERQERECARGKEKKSTPVRRCTYWLQRAIR